MFLFVADVIQYHTVFSLEHFKQAVSRYGSPAVVKKALAVTVSRVQIQGEGKREYV